MDFVVPLITSGSSGLMALVGVWLGQRLSGQVADKQRVWNQKRDTYSGLLAALSELNMITGAIAKYMSVELTEFSSGEIDKLNEQRYRVVRDYGRTRDLAQIFLSAEATAVLRDLENSFGAKSEGNQFRMAVCEAIDKGCPLLIAAARKELGT